MENTKERILSLLEHARGDSRSGQQMAEQLGVTRAAVWKAIDQLKKEGHRIEAVNNRGYCLLPESDVLTKSAMEPWLPTSYDAGLLHVYSEVDSTNDRAKKLAAQGAPEGTAVVAARQTAGKGEGAVPFFRRREAYTSAWCCGLLCRQSRAPALPQRPPCRSAGSSNRSAAGSRPSNGSMT